jgi:protein required for attachment to host cells
MNNVWILVCNAARARIFETDGAGAAWSMVEVFGNPAGREGDEELVRDRAGSKSPPGGSVHHNALASKTSPKEVAEDKFVRTVVDALAGRLASSPFEHLVLVAPPHVLGLLRDGLPAQLTKRLLATVVGDFEHLDAASLATKLHANVAIPLPQREVVHANENHRHGADGTVHPHR